MDGVDPLWCWAHIRRYFIRAGDAHEQLRYWRDAWVARIADLYLAHRAMAATSPATVEYATAQAAFEQALDAIDTARHEQMRGPGLHPAARKVLATLDREWDGLARHRDSPTWTWTTTNPSGPYAPPSSGARTSTAATPSGPRTWPHASGPSPPPPSATTTNPSPT